MGLASKLAAAGGAGGGASAGYPGQPPQYQAYNPGQPPQQGGYGQQPPPGQPGQYPPPQQYQQGAYPPPAQQQQYQQGGYPQAPGQPPRPAGPQEIAAYKTLLSKCINENQLQPFYPNPAALDQLAAKGAAAIPGLAARWHIDLEIARDLVQLALYDIVIFIDDSGSMQFAENGERIKDLKLILERVASVATVFDEDGISLRFMNASRPISEMENVRSEQQIRQVIDTATFSGYTPLGSQLRAKVVDGIISQKLRSGQYNKPHLVIVVTDGEPSEDKKLVRAAVKASADALRSARKPPSGVAFQIAQVGNDDKARAFLATLDEDAELGRLVDCTSNYESESDEMARKGVTLTPDLWLVKLMLGAIDRSYDSKDESGATGGYAPPQGQYGQQQYPPQQYGGPPQQQYGAPPPGQYPPQYGAPPQGQYGQQQPYGQQQYPQQGQQNYGRGGPPYPGAPPVPPRY